MNIRSIDSIFQQLLAEKQTLSNLSALVPNGIVSEDTLIPQLSDGAAPDWVLWLYNFAVAANLTDVATKSAVDEVANLLAQEKVPTLQWYILKAKEFQYGDIVTIDPTTYRVGYNTLDTSKQIIGSVTTLEVDNTLTLKIRGKNTPVLTSEELNAFVSYMQKVKAAGTRLVVENYDGDLLTLNLTILYDPIYKLSTIRTNVEAAINNYIANLDFNSKFLTNKLVDDLQAIAGVSDARFIGGSAINALGGVEDFTFEYVTNAGWGQINPSTPLSSTITYTAN